MPERWRSELKKLDRISPSENLLERAERGPSRPLPGPRPGTRIAIAIFALLVASAGTVGVFSAIRHSGGSAGTQVASGADDFFALWPEQTLADAQAAQQAVDAGDPALQWRLQVDTSLERFGTDVLGWEQPVVGPCITATNSTGCAGGTDAVVLMVRDGCATCNGMAVELQRLVRPGDGGIWNVTQLAWRNVGLRIARGDTVYAGQRVATMVPLAEGSVVGFGYTYFSGDCRVTGGTTRPSTIGLVLDLSSGLGACGPEVDGYLFAYRTIDSTLADEVVDPFGASGRRFDLLEAVPVHFSTSPSPSPTPSVTPGPTLGGCTAAGIMPVGTELRLTAKDWAFLPPCLQVPAGQDFTIVFDNQDDGVSHNVAIYGDAAGVVPLFQGESVTGPGTVTYEVPALQAGTYLFRDDANPAMHGTLYVRQPPTTP